MSDEDDVFILRSVPLATMRKTIQKAAHSIQELMSDIEDDWTPVAFFSTETEVTVMQIPPNLLGSEMGKDLLCEVVLPMAIEKIGATSYALLLSAWTLERSKNEPLDVRVSEHPDKKEHLILSLADQKHSEFWRAEIKRPEGASRPELGEWVSMDADFMEGRFFDYPMQALRGLEEK